MLKSCLSSTKLNDIPNHDDFRIIWISFDNAPRDLVDFDNHLKKYESCEACENDIKKFESKLRFVAIVKNSIPETDFESLCQIQSIYILLEKNVNIDYNPTNHPKVVGSFKNIDAILNHLLRRYLSISTSSLQEIKSEQSLTKLDEKTFIFLWNQIFIYYLIHPNEANMEQLKMDMLEQCELDYNNNEVQLRKIKCFDETCSDENAIQWYTKDSFLYRMLNKAFRTKNIDLMCKFQYFMTLLYQNFERLSKSQNKYSSIVYRGQIMYKNELDKLRSNVGSLISINTMLSTSRDHAAASVFIRGAENAVIFKINIPNQNDKSFLPFIDISEFSELPSEEEVLFFMGTVFSLDSIQNQPDGPCVIELTLNDDLSNHFRKLVSIFLPAQFLLSIKIDDIVNIFVQQIKYKPRSIMRTDDYNMFNQYYYILTGKQTNFGLYAGAIYLYKKVLESNHISTTNPESIIIHMIIGYLYYHSSEYDEASLNYAIVLSVLDEEKLLTGELYRHLGDIQMKKDNADNALSYYEDALRIAGNQHIPSIKYIYEQISHILEQQGNFNNARMYKIQSEKTDLKKYYLSVPAIINKEKLISYQSQLNNETEPVERVNLFYKSGIYYFEHDQFKEALESFLEAKSIYENQPSSCDPFYECLPTLFENIAMLYLFFKDYIKALVLWRKAIDIRINSPSN
ncbi:unnamed protein product [Rotaria magnacalcarata]|uniref:NAD(P)(+)--arginine ADP-ribosyltransferase n=1 Tax=Rotaria magnacalcarata TaxID=392030 RepID=A0A816FRY8_9BILA|nr:unnamed protein product [Rotaria magnacalcarata]CAF4082783.1 unnamed protein product [Rotaria magnacalcarata]